MSLQDRVVRELTALVGASNLGSWTVDTMPWAETEVVLVESTAGWVSGTIRETWSDEQIRAALRSVVDEHRNESDPERARRLRNQRDPIPCECGCGASRRGWSDIGRARGFRDGIARVHAPAHGRCYCGRDRDQYGECEHGGLDQVGGILAEFGMMPEATAERISHSHREHRTYGEDR